MFERIQAAKRREGLGEQRLADVAILPNAVCRSFRRNQQLSRQTSRAASDKHNVDLIRFQTWKRVPQTR